MRCFDLSSYKLFMFPMKDKYLSYDYIGDSFVAQRISYLNGLPKDMFDILMREVTFKVVMRNENKLGLREYICSVIDFDIYKRNIEFSFMVNRVIEPKEYRKQRIENVMKKLTGS